MGLDRMGYSSVQAEPDLGLTCTVYFSARHSSLQDRGLQDSCLLWMVLRSMLLGKEMVAELLNLTCRWSPTVETIPACSSASRGAERGVEDAPGLVI